MLYFIETDHAGKPTTVVVRGTVDDVNWQLDMDTHGAFDDKAGVLLHRGFHTVARAPRRCPAAPDPNLQDLFHRPLAGRRRCRHPRHLSRPGRLCHRRRLPFGEPKFTNPEGVRRYAYLPVLRIVYQNDGVAMLPDAVKGGSARYAHLGPEIVLLQGPNYCYLDQASAAAKSVGAFSRGITFTSLPDHKMKWYIQGLRDKLDSAILVPYDKRHRYVTRHKLGTGVETSQARKKTNFNRRATY